MPAGSTVKASIAPEARIDEALASSPPSATNRIALAVCLGCAIFLITDMILTLSHGRGFQYVRHSIGPLLLMYFLVMLVRYAGYATQLYRELTLAVLASNAGEELSDAEVAAILGRVAYRKLGLMHFFFGPKLARSTLHRQVRLALRSTERVRR